MTAYLLCAASTSNHHEPKTSLAFHIDPSMVQVTLVLPRAGGALRITVHVSPDSKPALIARSLVQEHGVACFFEEQLTRALQEQQRRAAQVCHFITQAANNHS